RGPVDRPLVRLIEDVPASFTRTLELAMNRKALGHGQQTIIQLLQPFEWHCRLRLCGGAWRRAHRPRLDAGVLAAETPAYVLQRVEPGREHAVGLFCARSRGLS